MGWTKECDTQVEQVRQKIFGALAPMQNEIGDLRRSFTSDLSQKLGAKDMESVLAGCLPSLLAHSQKTMLDEILGVFLPRLEAVEAQARSRDVRPFSASDGAVDDDDDDDTVWT